MNEFQYDSTPQEQAMADLLKSQSHRLARQQIIFALIFLLIIVLAAYYIVTRMIWAIYDGYVRLDARKQHKREKEGKYFQEFHVI